MATVRFPYKGIESSCREEWARRRNEWKNQEHTAGQCVVACMVQDGPQDQGRGIKPTISPPPIHPNAHTHTHNKRRRTQEEMDYDRIGKGGRGVGGGLDSRGKSPFT